MPPADLHLARLWPDAWSPAWQGFAYGVLVVLAIWGGWFLWRRLRGDRGAPALAEVRFRRLFEEATVALIEEDFTAVAQRLDELRAQGVTDLRAQLVAQPGLALELFRIVRPTAVNRRALVMMNAADLADYRRRMTEHTWNAAPRGFTEQLLALWEGRDALTIEAAFRTHDGQVHRGILQWTVPHEGGRRNFSQVLLVFTDLTAQRETEERYRHLFEHTPIAILESDDSAVTRWLAELRARGVTDLAAYLRDHPAERAAQVLPLSIVGANAAALRMVGAATLEEAVSRLPTMVTPDVQAFREEAILGLWAGVHNLDREVMLTALDGSPRRVHAYRWFPVVDGQAQYHRAQLALVDQTATHAAQQALEAERERLSVTLRAMAEGVITSDATGVVQYLNESACAIAGCTAAEAVGRRLEEVCVLRHAITDQSVGLPDAAARAAGRVVELPPDTVVVGADGTRRQVEGRSAPLHDLQGRDLGAVLVVRDVTEHVRLESELRRASNLESIGILAGGIAHDFNNILAIIMGNLTLALLDEQVKQSGGKRWLLEAERGAARARDLTQQLLTFAKGGEPVRTNVQLPELVREAAEFALHGSSVRCEFTNPPGLRTANVDKAQIGQVVQNLVLNAVQAMPAGGVIRIAMGNVTLAEDEHPPLAAGDYLRLSIADTGRGIHPDHLPRIFEPYFTTKSAGVGLGLATVYSIVRKHRGHIMVESELDAGTTFHLWLPAAAEAEAPRRPNPAPFAEAMQGRVLFMDDEEPIRLMAAVLLGRLGLDPTIAGDGAEAVQHFRKAHAEGRPFDVVVMDLTVPGGMGGLEALHEMRAIDPGVRAVVSSGYSSDPVLADFRAHGFRGMVAKPYRITDLAAALRAVMDEDKAG